MKYNRTINEVLRDDVTVEELVQYRNTLQQRRWYYNDWFDKRQKGIGFKDTTNALKMNEVAMKVVQTDREIDIVNGLIKEKRDNKSLLSSFSS